METGYVELFEICRDLGIAIEPRATEAQNGAIERAGKAILNPAPLQLCHSMRVPGVSAPSFPYPSSFAMVAMAAR